MYSRDDTIPKGKEFWQNKVVLGKEFEKRFIEEYRDQITFTPVNIQTIFLHFPDESFNLLSSMFISAVLDEKVKPEINQLLEKEAINIYINDPKDNTKKFSDLDSTIRNQYIEKAKLSISMKSIEEVYEAKRVVATQIAKLTIERIEKLAKEGKIKLNSMGKPITTPFAILYNITESFNQEVYLDDSEYEKWLSTYYQGEIPIKSDGSIDWDALGDEDIEVYCFQCGDLGTSNFMKFEGNIGASDGMFVISKSDYDELLKDQTLFDENKKCINIPELSARLGNVSLGNNPICIKQTVKLKNLKSSNGAFSTAYFGEWCPGFKTQGGYYDGNKIEGKPEAVVSSTKFLNGESINPNIELISHSNNISSEDLVRLATTYLKTANKFLEERNRSTDSKMDHWTLTNNIAKDSKLLEQFKEKLAKEESSYIIGLMASLGVNTNENSNENKVGGAKK